MIELMMAAALSLVVPEAPWKDGAKAEESDVNVTAGYNWKGKCGFVCPHYDKRGNILLNPSFESGDRYWSLAWNETSRWGTDEISTNYAHSGTHSFSPRTRGHNMISQVVLREKTRYAVSCWALNPNGDGAAPCSIGVRGDMTSAKSVKLVPVGGAKPGKGEWVRYTGTLETPANLHECVMIVGMVPGYYYDDFQIEEGELTDYRGNPFGLDLVLDSPEEHYSDARTDAKPRIRLTGPKDAKGEVSVKVKDFFNRRVAAVEQKFDLSSGALEIALDDAALPKGILVAEVTVKPDPRLTTNNQQLTTLFTDYLRWAKIDYLDNTQKNKRLMGAVLNPPHVSAEPNVERLYRLNAHFGFGATSYCNCGFDYSDPNHFENMPNADDLALIRKYGLDNFGQPLSSGSNGRMWVNGQDTDMWKGKVRRGGYVWNDESYSEDFLLWMETNVCAIAKRHPALNHWAMPTEPDHHTSAQRDAYAQLLLRIYKGIKAGNPDADLMPYGSYNMFQQGRASVIDMMRRIKRADPDADKYFPYIEIHTYRELPERPDVEDDLVAFIEGLKDAGYPDIKVKTGEGSYYMPVVNSPNGMVPWTGVGHKDAYSHIAVPTYDLGWGEQIAAALTVRETAVYYKHSDRVIENTSWTPRFLDGKRTIAWLAANAALGKMLGDATIVKDIRFAVGSRAYVFDDGHGSTVAICWKGDEAFDRGDVGGTTMALKMRDEDLEVFDMMGNQVKVEGEGEQRKIILPLSGFPIYLKVSNAKRQALIEALETCEIAADMEKLPLQLVMKLLTPTEAELKVVNPLTRPLAADIEIGGKTTHVALAAKTSQSIRCTLSTPVSYAAFADVAVPVKVAFRGKVFEEKYATRALAVTKVPGSPDWSKIPAAPVENHRRTGMGDSKQPWTGAPDFAATVQLAYDADNLYLRVNVTDDRLVWPEEAPDDWQSQYAWDAVQLYFDAFGNGREKEKFGSVGYDMDDFSYELLPSNATTAVVYRRLAPDHQFRGGALTGYQSKVVEGDIPCTIEPFEGGYSYVVTFPKAYIRPLPLDGTVTPGFSLEIYDRDNCEKPKAWWDNSKSAAWMLPDIPGENGAFQSPHRYTTLVFER